MTTKWQVIEARGRDETVAHVDDSEEACVAWIKRLDERGIMGTAVFWVRRVYVV